MAGAGNYVFKVLFLVACVSNDVQSKIPDYIETCNRNDPKVDQCIIHSVENLRSTLTKGIPELTVPPIEPLIIPKIDFSTGNGAANVRAVLRNMKVKGPSQFKVTWIGTNIDEHVFDFGIDLPSLVMDSDYELNVKILLLPVKGEGKFQGSFNDTKADVKMIGHIIEKDGKSYLEFDDFKIKMKVRNASVHFGNLFQGNRILGEATNAILNENSESFIEEITPAVEDALAALFKGIANRITLKFTYDELFPES